LKNFYIRCNIPALPFYFYIVILRHFLIYLAGKPLSLFFLYLFSIFLIYL